MGGLQKRPEERKIVSSNKTLPSLDLRGMWLSSGSGSRPPEGLPRASVVYGVGAGGLLAAALYSFFTGAWLTGGLIGVLSGLLFAYALYFIRYAGGGKP